MGARVGNVIYSSGIMGKAPGDKAFPEDAATQTRNTFENMKALLAAGGSCLEDVVRMTVYIKDESVRPAVNVEWLKCFPDPHDRPARHVVSYDLRNGMLVQIEIVAVVQD